MPSPDPTLPRDDAGPVRLGIVGTGEISPRFLGQPDPRLARFVATCARTLASARTRAEEFGIPSWYDDYEAMYDAEELDGVVIATPHSVHAAPVIAALDRGIPVLCEKPMATTFEDCRAMVEAATRTGTLFLNLPWDASPSGLAVLDHLDEDTLGAFVGAEANLSLPGGSRPETYSEGGPGRVSDGGALLSTLVYPVSTLITMFGPARRVTGFANTLLPSRILGPGPTIDVVPPPRNPEGGTVVDSIAEDNVTLLIEWEGGQQATIRSLWATSFFVMSTVVYGRRGTLALEGGETIIHSPDTPIPGAEPVTWRGQTDCYRLTPEASPGEGLVDHFADCIRGRAVPRCGADQSLHVHEILFGGYEAATTGRTRELTTTFTPWRDIPRSFLDTRSRPL